jgi:protein subunit release factor A
MMAGRELIFRVTAADCEWDYFRGSGNGGQKRQKTSSAVRCRHLPSGAIGVSQDSRSQKLNKRAAFRKMAESKEFERWMRMETARKLGLLDEVERYVESAMSKDNILVEVKVDDRWVEERDEQLQEEADCN